MNKKFRKLILPVSILATSHAYALGLGDLQVNSALDEELNGQIPILVDSEEDITNIKVALASSDDYKRVDLDKSFVPSNIKVDILDENNRKFIVISSKGPVSEPIVSLLLSVDWANGHLLREYTILLDPPLFNTSQTQQNYSDPVQTETYQAPAKIESEEQTIPSSNTNQSYTSSGSNQVVVEAGDTLWKIAGTINQGYGSQQQMMVALFNNNPSAFSNNDMNRLKKGAILDVPKADQVTMLSTGEAIAEVKSHLQNWSNLQTQDNGGSSSDSSSSVDYGIELVPPNDSDSSNSYNSSGSSSENAQNRAELSRLKEQLASSNLENDELSSRVYELEQIVKDQEMALNLKDNSLAQLQQQVTDASNNETTDLETNIDTVDEENSSDDVWDDSTEDSTDDSLVESDTTNIMTDQEVADDAEYDDVVEDTGYEDENLNDSNADTEIVSIINEADEPVDTNTTTENQTTSNPVAEKSFMDKIMDYKFEGLIGLGALVVAGLAFVFIRRRKDEELEEGNFLDSISNNKKEALNEDNVELENDTGLEDFNESNEELDLDLSNSDFEDDFEDSLEEDEVPEVIVMDDQSDDETESEEINKYESHEETDQEEATDIDDFNIDDLDLDETEEELDDVDYSEIIDKKERVSEIDNDEFSLDLDLDDLDFSNDNNIDKKETLQTNNDNENDNDEIELSLDLDEDLNDESNDDTEEEFTLDFDTENLDLDDLDENSDELELDLTVDENLLNINKENQDEEDTVGNLEFDLSDDLYDSDNINVDSESSKDDSTEYDAVSIDIDDHNEIDIGLDFDDIIDDDAIDTKLDLAKAYFEMGDIEGAKQMVIEIIEEGSEEQKAKAESLKKEIDN